MLQPVGQKPDLLSQNERGVTLLQNDLVAWKAGHQSLDRLGSEKAQPNHHSFTAFDTGGALAPVLTHASEHRNSCSA